MADLIYKISLIEWGETNVIEFEFILKSYKFELE